MSLHRRTLLKSAAAFGVAAPFMSSGSAFAQEAKLRTYWWGGQDRQRRTEAVNDLFAKKIPGLTVFGESNSADYWQKLNTMMGARNVSDVFQLEPSTISDYGRRNACLPLDGMVGKTLDIEGFGKNIVDLCRIDGKLYGVALGLNAFSMFYNADLLKELNIAAPNMTTTWAQYADKAVEITKAAKKDNFWGSVDGSRYNYALESWLHTKGKLLYSPEGKLGFTEDDALEWYTYWSDMRKRGGCVPADVQAIDALGIDSNALSAGKCAMNLAFSNQMIGYQGLVKSKLGINTNPTGGPGAKPGQFYRPGLIWSISSNTKTPELAAQYINFFVNDIEAGKVLGVERGVPLSSKVREAVLPLLNETEKATVQFVNDIADKVGSYPPPAPKGSTEFDRNVMRPVADQVAFGKISVKDGAKMMMDEGSRVL